MGYNSDPSLYNYSVAPNVCGLCYPVNETPEQVFIGFSGIIKGPLAGGGDPPAPNDVFQLDATGPCTWTAAHAPFNFTLNVSAGAWELEIMFGGTSVFFDPNTIDCLRRWTNIQQNDAIFDYNFGSAVIANPLEQGGASIADLQAELGLPPAPGDTVQLRPAAGGLASFTIGRKIDASSLKIQIENY